MSPLVPYTEKGVNFSVKKESNQPSQHLLYSVNNEIRLHLDGDGGEYRIAERSHDIKALAIHDNRLVDASGKYISYTEPDGFISGRPGVVNALAVYKNRLVDAGDYEQICYTRSRVFLAERVGGVTSLAIYKKRLIDIDRYGIISYTKTNELAERCLEKGAAIAVHGDQIFAAENDREAGKCYGRVLRTQPWEWITERSEWINALATYKGRLIDAGYYNEIFYTKEDELILETDGPVFALLPIDEQMARRLLTLPEARKVK
jgi:hypothetical protein